ncbi:hypothetical protein [Kitasatospora sp. NPDC057015]|uniref:hypothetical protein n=1 Tax=Kitasatospora sp. NPDC057015 TaxID=3346001 RepID=UPI003626DABD
MTQPTPSQSYAQHLRALADRLDAQHDQDGRPTQPGQALLQILIARDGLFPLTREVAATVRTDLDGWHEALRPDPSSSALYDLSHRIAEADDAIADALTEAALQFPSVMYLMADHAGPAPAAAAALAVEQRLWNGPQVRGGERVHLFWPDGSTHAPVLGLAQADGGYVDPYGSVLFTRAVAEQVIADLLGDNADFQAAFEPDGSLLYTWPQGYDGKGGRMHVVPDDRGLYAIGGQWPWDYRRPGNADSLPRAQAARIASRTLVPPGGVPEAGAQPSAPVYPTTTGRAR